MKIWFTEIGEPLPMEADARLHRYGNFTRYLASRGHDVTWWTSNFSHAVKHKVVEGGLDHESHGVTLRVIEGLGYRRNVSVARFRHQADFAAKFYERAPQYPRPDLIVTPIPTIEAAERAVRFAKHVGVPVVVDIRDEWPDDLVNLAPGPLRWAGRLLLSSYIRRMNYLCQNATGIVGISQRQLQHGLRYAKRAQGPQDGVFPLGYSGKTLADPEKLATAHRWWREQGLAENAFVVCFFGTIGKFFELETVIEAGRILSREFPIQFVLCGDGGSLEKYRRLAKGNSAVLLPGWVDAPKIAALMQASDCALAPYRSNAESMSLPNKPFEYFSGGLPVVSSIQTGELRELLATHRCGETYRSDDVEGLCQILRRWHADPALCEQMGANGRRLLESQFTSESIYQRFEEHLSKLAQGGTSPTKGASGRLYTPSPNM